MIAGAKLADLVHDLQSGFACGDAVANGVVQLRMNNVDTEGAIDFSSTRRVPRDAVRDLDKFLIAEGDVMFNNTNSPELVGKSAVFRGFTEPVVFSNHFTRIRTRRDRLEPRYLARWLASEWRRGRFARMCNQWVNQAAVPRTALLEMDVPVPSMQEQRRIADILDKADAIRRRRKQAIALTGDLLRSAFLDMFGDPVTNPKGWQVKPLGQVAEAVSGVAKGKRYGGQDLVTLPYMRVANVQDGHLDLEEVKTITVSEDDAERYLLQSGDVLLTEGGDPDKLGRGAVWRGEVARCIHQNHIFRVRPGPEVDPDYLAAIISSERGKRYFLKAAKQTTGIATINMGQLKAFPTLVPPPEVQSKYVIFARRTSGTRDALRAHEKNVGDLFGSLVSRAFAEPLTHVGGPC